MLRHNITCVKIVNIFSVHGHPSVLHFNRFISILICINFTFMKIATVSVTAIKSNFMITGWVHACINFLQTLDLIFATGTSTTWQTVNQWWMQIGKVPRFFLRLLLSQNFWCQVDTTAPSTPVYPTILLTSSIWPMNYAKFNFFPGKASYVDGMLWSLLNWVISWNWHRPIIYSTVVFLGSL